MSGDTNDGGPAFPGFEYTEGYGSARRNSAGEWENFATGMTLRDYFAAKALPTVIVQCASDTRKPNESLEHFFARKCYELADAMLRVRSA